MRDKGISWVFILLIGATSFVVPHIAQATQPNEKAIQQVVGQFYSALNILFTGDSAPMEQLWSHADDVTYMGPMGGLYVGWDQILPVWREQADLKLGGSVNPKNMQIVVGRDLAVTSNYEVGENIDKDGNPQKVSIRATNTFRKEDGQWKMIGHHTDLLPYLQK